MLGFPKSTELSKIIPKKAIYQKFQMSTAERAKMDEDIARIAIVNELTPEKLNLAPGEKVKSFYVLHITLKHCQYDEKSIIKLTKLIPQNIIFVLEHEDAARVAIYHTKLLETEWKPLLDFSIHLSGLDLDAVWENIIIQIGGITIEQGNTLDEQIAVDEQKIKLQKEIDRLTKLAKAEKQPKKKFELVQKIKKLTGELHDL